MTEETKKAIPADETLDEMLYESLEKEKMQQKIERLKRQVKAESVWYQVGRFLGYDRG